LHILFITSAHNSLSQRLQIELSDRGHRISIAVVKSSDDMLPAVARHRPDLIVAPMLKAAIPEIIWSRHTCLIVHPGIEGDRGPSSLDWAIQNQEQEWGVTVLQAAAEMDAGDIWASQRFPLSKAGGAKSSIYRHEVTEAAVRAVLEAVTRFESGAFQPKPLDYNNPDVRGQLRAPMRQPDRRIDWKHDSTEVIVRKIHAADSQPGVLDSLFGKPYYLYGAHAEDIIKGAPGVVLAQRDGAICRGTVDGAVWITHLKAKDHGPRANIKLPAMQVLGAELNIPNVLPGSETLPAQRTFREIRYVECDRVGYLYFDFYNGAMSVDQCRRLRDAFLAAQARPTRVIVLFGGRDFWSNGIHLNVIEAASDPAMESWRNINAINDLIGEILDTTSHLVFAGLRGNAGAGGAMLALAADRVYARRGVVINPHYKGMGGLFGSEYWTYTLRRRVGSTKAIELTERCLPIGTRAATEMGFLDAAFGDDVPEFEQHVMHKAAILANDPRIEHLVHEKHQAWLANQRRKPFAAYRSEELRNMWNNFFGPDPAYHEARRRFVFKGTPVARERERASPEHNIRNEATPMAFTL
jgi:putative two-component system hydrogenase maturation factor HypX/HoxX